MGIQWDRTKDLSLMKSALIPKSNETVFELSLMYQELHRIGASRLSYEDSIIFGLFFQSIEFCCIIPSDDNILSGVSPFPIYHLLAYDSFSF